MRAEWTPEELDGHVLVWLVEIHFPTGIVRYATRTVDVIDGSSSYHYPGTSDPMVYAEKADLFDAIPSPSEMGISGYVDVDLAAAYLAGHRFSYLYAEVSQVRAKERPEGPKVVDSYSDRLRLIVGRTRAPQWGKPMSSGHSWFAADIVNEWFATGQTIPPYGYAVANTTWPEASRARTDEGVTFPMVIGFPGYDANSTFLVPAAPVCWLSRQYATFQLICAGVGELDATQMQLVRGLDPIGKTVTLATEYEKYGGGGSAYPALTTSGILLTVVDYHAEGYGNGGGSDLGSDYYPTTVDESDVFVAFGNGQGGMMWRGQLLRGAGDVLTWALEQTGYRVDYGRTAAAAPWLNTAKIDTILSARVNAAEWIQQQLLPLLPVSMMSGPEGIYPLVWRPDVGPEDCVTIDADADARIEVSDTSFDDDSETANRFTVEYGWDANARATRFVVRVGPGAGSVPESEDYATTFIDNNTPMTARVRIKARAQGFNGAGITILAGASGAATSCSDTGAKEVTINIDNTGPSETNETIAAVINAGSLLVSANPEADSAVTWGEANPATSVTYLRDYGTHPDPRCESSRIRRRREEGDNGIVDAPTVSAPAVMDHATALWVASWMAAAKAPTRTTVSVEAPDEVMTRLRPLGAVRFTCAALGFSARIGWAEEVERHSDGRTAARLVFLG